MKCTIIFSNTNSACLGNGLCVSGGFENDGTVPCGHTFLLLGYPSHREDFFGHTHWKCGKMGTKIVLFAQKED